MEELSRNEFSTPVGQAPVFIGGGILGATISPGITGREKAVIQERSGFGRVLAAKTPSEIPASGASEWIIAGSILAGIFRWRLRIGCVNRQTIP